MLFAQTTLLVVGNFISTITSHTYMVHVYIVTYLWIADIPRRSRDCVEWTGQPSL